MGQASRRPAEFAGKYGRRYLRFHLLTDRGLRTMPEYGSSLDEFLPVSILDGATENQLRYFFYCDKPDLELI